MKARELMLGDWVQCVFGFGKIVHIGNPYIIVSIDGKERLRDDSFFNPIPITAEILEKNGFRKLVTYGTEKWLCNNFRLNVYSSDGTWRFCADTNRNEDSVIYIRFVHELQHALTLCGIDKEIML